VGLRSAAAVAFFLAASVVDGDTSGTRRADDALMTSVLDVRALNDASRESLASALARMRDSIDPCGESADVRAILRGLAACPGRYAVHTSVVADRNVLERPADAPQGSRARTIVWNPALRSEIERGCDGDPSKPVLRDPTASLLHELVHALQDCHGLNPGAYELDAVRIENVYRRAAGLCQRGGYGDAHLAPEMVKRCDADACPCTTSAVQPAAARVAPRDAAATGVSADAAPTR